MKNILCLIILMLLMSCQWEKGVRTLTVTIDESINQTSQWVYWFSLYGNEMNIIDSCWIEKGQSKFILRDTILNDSIVLTELVFSEVLIPWEYSYLRIDSNDKDIRIDNLTSEGLHRKGSIIRGALAEEEHRKIFSAKEVYNHKIEGLRDSLAFIDYDDTITMKRIVAEMESIRKYITQNIVINQFDSAKSTTTIARLIADLKLSMRKEEVPKEIFDSIAQVMARRYPNDIKVQEAIKIYVEGKTSLSPSTQSNFWMKRKNNIRYLAYNKNLYKLKDGNSSLNGKSSNPPGIYRAEVDSTNVPAYKLGDKIGPLKLKNTAKNYSSITDLKTDYILIDFWATWCAPCINEIPALKRIHDKYKGKLSIYAISLDNTDLEWMEGIEKYKCRQFTHVYAGSWAKEDIKLLTNSFGVTTIPANFLLNKERKIIAINLSRDELEKKLQKLIKN